MKPLVSDGAGTKPSEKTAGDVPEEKRRLGAEIKRGSPGQGYALALIEPCY
jgi:hypothetical protein